MDSSSRASGVICAKKTLLLIEVEVNGDKEINETGEHSLRSKCEKYIYVNAE